MRTLTGLSGEYVTFDQNGQNAASAEFGILAASLPNWRFRRINDVIPVISRTVKVKIFPYFKILNFRSGDVTFLRNAKTAIFTKNEGKNRTTLSAITNSTKSRLEINEELPNSRGRSELQLLCCYNSCKAVASNGEGWKPALRVSVNSTLRSLIHRIQESGRVSGRELLWTYIEF